MTDKTDHIITEEQLLDRQHISNDEIMALAEQFGLTKNDLADACDCTYSTFDIYLGDNSTKMPKKHQETLIHLFLRRYGYQNISENETSSQADQGSQSEDEKTIEVNSNNEIQPNMEKHEHIDQNFEHLSFAGIYFTPKNGDLGSALEEAAEYSDEAGVPVHVKTSEKTFKIECDG